MMIVAMIIMVGVIRLLFLIWFLERPRVEADRDAEESLVAFSYDDGVGSDYDYDDDDDDDDDDNYIFYEDEEIVNWGYRPFKQLYNLVVERQNVKVTKIGMCCSYETCKTLFSKKTPSLIMIL